MYANAICILVCAGSSTRVGSLGLYKSKVLVELSGCWTVLHEVLSRILKSGVNKVVLVCSEALQEDFQNILDSFKELNSYIVIGGSTRSKSVRNGINEIDHVFNENTPQVVFVHDGARPFFSVELLKQAIQDVAKKNEGIVFGVPVVNTIKVCASDMQIKNTLNRDELWEVQTPQVFPYLHLREAYASFNSSDTIYDDSALLERAGYPVSIIKSSSLNFKITTKEDIDRAIFEYNRSL